MRRQELVFSAFPHGAPLFAGGRRPVNMYAEKAEAPARSEFVLKGAPGMKLWSTPSGASGLENRGFHTFSETTYGILGSFLYSFASDGTATQVASGISGSGPVSFASDNDQMVIVTTPGTDDFIFTASGGLSQLTGTNIVDWRDVAFIDGRAVFVQNDPDIAGRFSWTDVNQLGTVGASSFANSESSPDPLRRILKVGRILWMLGTRTAEPWYTTGDGTTPFARQANYITPIGIGADNSRVALRNRGFFLGVSDQEAPSVQMIEGGQVRRVSNNAIDDIIGSGTYSDAIGFAYAQHGHDFYCLVLPATGRTFIYDANLGAWHERQSGVDIVGSWDARQIIFAHNKILVGHKDDGKIYELDFDTQTDGNAKRMAMFFAEIKSSGGYWNTLDEVFVDMTVGEAPAGASTEPQIIMQKSTDGGRTWGNERWRGIGFSGDYDRLVTWHGLGQFRTCLVRFRITDNVPREIVNVFARGEAGREV